MNMDYTLMLCGKDAFSYFFLSTCRRPPRSWANWQKPAKKQMRKFVKLTGHTYKYLEQFDKFSTRKRKSSESAKNLFEKTREITSRLQ